jgi:hypothetical protein
MFERNQRFLGYLFCLAISHEILDELRGFDQKKVTKALEGILRPLRIQI